MSGHVCHRVYGRQPSVLKDGSRTLTKASSSPNNFEREQIVRQILKCEFWLQKVSFFGHVVSKEGISVDPTKIDAVTKWDSPTTVTEVHSFLELAGYYQRFIQYFTFIASPLTQLTKKGIPFLWKHANQVSKI